MHTQNLINSGFQAVVPSDTAAVNYDGLIIGGSGVVTVVDAYGNTTAITVVAGQVIPGKIVLVKATGTTATLMVGLLP